MESRTANSAPSQSRTSGGSDAGSGSVTSELMIPRAKNRPSPLSSNVTMGTPYSARRLISSDSVSSISTAIKSQSGGFTQSSSDIEANRNAGLTESGPNDGVVGTRSEERR